MTKKLLYTFIAVAGSAMCVVFGCREPQKPVAEQQPVHTFSVKGSVREMMITPETVDFPEHPGKTEFISYCAICHSLRYISTQPEFPRKTWQAEVEKMIAKYGAPIDTAISRKIVDYLVEVKGSKPAN